VDLFDQMQKEGHEQVVFCHDRASGLKLVIAIHDTTLGPALGGCRMWPYANEEAAVTDALRLSKGMTYKSAAAGMNHGGGKCVIWGNPATDKSEELFRALGRFIGGLRGRMVTGTDVGTVPDDFVWAHAETDFLVALPEAYGGSGDSSVITAFGVWRGMKAAAREVWQEDSLKGRHIAVQGLGKVGAKLVDHLAEEGCRLTVTDVNPDYANRVKDKYPQVALVAAEEIYGVDCDIFSPCALGAIINDQTLPRLRCRVVAGSANNQLAEPRHGEALQERGILYCPDYVINSGGLIQVADELMGYNHERAFKKAAAIYDQLRQIFSIAREQGTSTLRAADLLAERRIARLGAVGRIYLPE